MAATNTPNYLDATWTPATPVNAIPNPDVDNAMGLGVQPGDSDATQFAKGLQSSMFRNTQEGRDLNTSLAKEKLANQLAAQLYERKMQLENQYQPYDGHTVTPWGAIVMTGKSGASQTINPMGGDQNDPSTPAGMAYQTYMSKMKAEKAAADEQSDPEVVAANKALAIAKPKYEESRANYEDVMSGEVADAKAAKYRADAEAKLHPSAKPDKPLTPMQEQQIQDGAIKQLYPGYDPKDQVGFNPATKQFRADMQKDPQGTISRINQKVQQIKDELRPGLGAPGPAAGSMGDLLNLGNSPAFSPSQDTFSQ